MSDESWKFFSYTVTQTVQTSKNKNKILLNMNDV